MKNSLARATVPVPNPGYDRTEKALRDAGYRCQDDFVRKPESGYVYPEIRFEVWTGPKGVVIVQVWKDGHGCEAYANWPLGSTSDDLKAAL